jgi:hypothetical protein
MCVVLRPDWFAAAKISRPPHEGAAVMSQATVAHRRTLAPELELRLVQARHGNPVEYGKENAARVTRGIGAGMIAVAGLVWTFNFWLVFSHAL